MSDQRYPEFPILGSRVIVAIAASLSVLSTTCLFLYVIALVFITHIYPRAIKTRRDTQLSTNISTPSPIDHKGFKNFSYPNRAHTSQTYYHPNKEDGTDNNLSAYSPLRAWAKQRLSFIRTPFGIMFMNLVWADFIQALGFGMNYFWVTQSSLTCGTAHCQKTCTVQGVLIQLGDLASAFSNLMIAIQTFVILTFSWHLPTWITWFSISLIWVPVFVLSFLAPTVMGNWSGPKPFYTWAGDWCWINEEYAPLRLFLHYLWIFIAAFASIALYGHLFLRLQIHFRNSKTMTRNCHHHHQASLGSSPHHHCLHGYHSTGKISRFFHGVKGWAIQKATARCSKCGAGVASSGSISRNNHAHDTFVTNERLDGVVVPLQADQLRKKLERKARAMLMYPIAFIFMILPLSTFRLAALAGHDWGVTAASVCGSIYCLSGFIDVLLFGTTRSIISVPIFSFKSHQRVHPQGATAIIGTNGIGMSSSGLGTRSVGFRVEVIQETVIDLDEPNEGDLHELKKNPNPKHDHHRRMSELNDVLPSDSIIKPVEATHGERYDSMDSQTAGENINQTSNTNIPENTNLTSFLNLDTTSSDLKSETSKPMSRYMFGVADNSSCASTNSNRPMFCFEPDNNQSNYPQILHHESQNFSSHRSEFTDPIPWQKSSS
ncbi:expressed protein [Phakopsora pachyrhizi]|uniref:Expressed protein n=1 Tax=Phakopsora pachyrhizi TaxID=170000 RepID=A0AAV0BSW0_PHAPC|nr:expressed protein [Phakopsora pachyrhizi]